MNNKGLFINEPSLITPSFLAKAIGLNETMVLQQLNYWLTKPGVGVERDGYKWVYNTYEQWHDNFPFWCTRTIRGIFRRLEKAGLVISAQFDKSRWDHTKYYRINYEALEKLVGTLTAVEDGNVLADDKIDAEEFTVSNGKDIPPSVEDNAISNGKDMPHSWQNIPHANGKSFHTDAESPAASLKESKNTTNNTTDTTAKNTNNASLAKASDAPSASEPPKPVVPRGVLDIFLPPNDLLPDNPLPDDLPPDDMYIFPPPDEPPPDEQPPDNRDKPAAPKLSDTAREFLRLFGAKRFKTQAQFEQFAEFERQYPPNTILDAARWASTMGMAVGGALIAMKTALKKWDQPKKTAKPMEKAYGLQINEPKGYAALRQWAKEEGINDLGI